jgi:hypothetical protein
MHRAVIGNRQQARTLFLVQDALELDVSFNEREFRRARLAIGTIFSARMARMGHARRTMTADQALARLVAVESKKTVEPLPGARQSRARARCDPPIPCESGALASARSAGIG